MRLGLDDYDGSVPDTNSPTFTYKVDIWTQNQYNHDNDSQEIPYNWPGGSGKLSYRNEEGHNAQVKRGTITVTYTYSTWGSSPGSLTFNAGPLALAYHGATPSHSKATVIPARPYAAPNPPTNLTATRNSDAQTTLTWDNSAPPQQPISSVTIQMRTYSGSAWSDYTPLETVNGAPTSYIVTGLSANRVYQFQVRTNNSGGPSSFTTSSNVYNTPTAPSPVAAALLPTGAQIEVTWTNKAYTSGTITHKIERSINGGGWTSVASGLAQSASSWTDPTPGGGSNQYRVATVTSSGPLSSSWTTSNSVMVADCWIWENGIEKPLIATVWDGTGETHLSFEFI